MPAGTDCSVSAVIPAFNSETFISATIESVLAQTHEVAEIIVVDDGSSDRTAQVAARFPKTRVITRANGGTGASRNTGIDAASGQWIAFLDHDDQWHPAKTQAQLSCVGPDVGVIYSNPFDSVNFGSLWHRQAHVSPSGALVRRQALLEVGKFEESRAVTGVEDLNLWLRIARAGWRFVRSQSGCFTWGLTGSNQSLNDTRMARAELSNIALIGGQIKCQPQELERLQQSCRIEYARNLIGSSRWDEACQLLRECRQDAAWSLLKIAQTLKLRRLARTDVTRWLQSLAGPERRPCTGHCDLPEQHRSQCLASSSLPTWRDTRCYIERAI